MSYSSGLLPTYKLTHAHTHLRCTHTCTHTHLRCTHKCTHTHLNGLASKDEEVLSSHHHEPHELFAQNLLNLIRLHTHTYENLTIRFITTIVETNVHLHQLGKTSKQIHHTLIVHDATPTCLIAMETRMELMEASMCTFSFSFLLTTSGVSNSSLLLLHSAREQSVE